MHGIHYIHDSFYLYEARAMMSEKFEVDERWVLADV